MILFSMIGFFADFMNATLKCESPPMSSNSNEEDGLDNDYFQALERARIRRLMKMQRSEYRFIKILQLLFR